MKTAAVLALAGVATAVDTVTYQQIFFEGQVYGAGDGNVDAWLSFPSIVDPTPSAYTSVAVTSSTNPIGFSCVNQTPVDNVAAAYNAQQTGFVQVCSNDNWMLNDCGASGYEVNVNGPICGCTTGSDADNAARIRPADTAGNWGGLRTESCPGITQVLGLTFTAPQVIVDPVFTGFDNSEFEFKGVPFEVFNIISDVDFQLNARFVPWTHGTFMGDLGFLLGEHSVEFHSNGTVLADGVAMKQNEEYTFGTTSVVFTGRDLNVHATTFTVSARILAENRIDFSTAANAPVKPHGVLGQTYGRERVHKVAVEGTLGEGNIEGTYVDYLVQDGLLGTNFAYNRFGDAKISARRSANSVDSVLAFGRGIRV